jgi:hypothetical protein
MIDLYELVYKVNGPIRPVGDSNTDAIRLANLKSLTELVDNLLTDINALAKDNEHSQQASVKKIARCASGFITDIRAGLKEKDTL